MRYELIIYWSKPDESFVVEVPELPGCMADGQTYEEAVANAQEVIAEWIDTARAWPANPRAAREVDVCLIPSPSTARTSAP
jgi:predicted RNase H-like HicB family nuclease